MPDMTSPDAQVAPDELVDTVLAASRALVAVAARSLAAAGDEVTLPQYRALVVLAAQGPQGTAELAAAQGPDPPAPAARRPPLRPDRADRAGPGPGRRGEQAAPGRAGPAAQSPAARGARAGHRGVPGFRGGGRRASAAGGRARLGGTVTRSRRSGPPVRLRTGERRACGYQRPTARRGARFPISCRPGPARCGRRARQFTCAPQAKSCKGQ